MDFSFIKVLGLGVLIAGLKGVYEFLVSENVPPADPFDIQSIVKNAVIGVLVGLIASAIAKLDGDDEPVVKSKKVSKKAINA